jgi:hypothetical protein
MKASNFSDAQKAFIIKQGSRPYSTELGRKTVRSKPPVATA